MLKPILTAAAFAALTVAAPAMAKNARCVIDSEGPGYRGPCEYHVARGGTFTITPVRSNTFSGGATSITVFMTRPGVAEVRGLSESGINSRWGIARRSRRDSACWTGSDFNICVY